MLVQYHNEKATSPPDFRKGEKRKSIKSLETSLKKGYLKLKKKELREAECLVQMIYCDQKRGETLKKQKEVDDRRTLTGQLARFGDAENRTRVSRDSDRRKGGIN